MNRAIYFKGSNCGVCQDLFPKVKVHFEQHYPLLEFQIVQVEDQPEIAAHYTIFTIPALLIFIEDKEQFRFVRYFSPGQIDEKLQRTYHLLFDE